MMKTKMMMAAVSALMAMSAGASEVTVSKTTAQMKAAAAVRAQPQLQTMPVVVITGKRDTSAKLQRVVIVGHRPTPAERMADMKANNAYGAK